MGLDLSSLDDSFVCGADLEEAGVEREWDGDWGVEEDGDGFLEVAGVELSGD